MSVPAELSPLTNFLLELEEDQALGLVKARLAGGEDPLAMIQEAQLGLRLVGERYEQGQYYVMGMMMAGEIFREVMELVEPVITQKTNANASGHILLGTVQGDIHDIGKNIFGVLLRCHGFTVTDLGVDVAPAQIAQEALRVAPDAVALSGLLTISYDSMKETVQQFRKQGEPRLAQTPFIIGGGTVNAMVCAFVGADYWAIDAMMGVQLCKQILAQRQ